MPCLLSFHFLHDFLSQIGLFGIELAQKSVTSLRFTTSRGCRHSRLKLATIGWPFRIFISIQCLLRQNLKHSIWSSVIVGKLRTEILWPLRQKLLTGSVTWAFFRMFSNMTQQSKGHPRSRNEWTCTVYHNVKIIIQLLFKHFPIEWIKHYVSAEILREF